MAKGKAARAIIHPDELRDRILRLLYERHLAARSPAKVAIGIRDLQKALKARFEMSQQEVSSNLDYLVQVGWVREVRRDRSFTTPGGMEVSQEQLTYKISDVGINHLQAGTMFKKPSSVGQVNITNIKGVTVVGDGNVVNTQFTDLSRALDQLDEDIGRSSLSDEDKLDAAGDLTAIRSQIAKKNPVKEVIRFAWTSLERLATAAGAADAIGRVRELLTTFIT